MENIQSKMSTLEYHIPSLQPYRIEMKYDISFAHFISLQMLFEIFLMFFGISYTIITTLQNWNEVWHFICTFYISSNVIWDFLNVFLKLRLQRREEHQLIFCPTRGHRYLNWPSYMPPSVMENDKSCACEFPLQVDSLPRAGRLNPVFLVFLSIITGDRR